MPNPRNGNSPEFVESLAVLTLLEGVVKGCESHPKLKKGQNDVKVWFAVLQRGKGYFLVPEADPAHWDEGKAHEEAKKHQGQGPTKVFGPFHIRPTSWLDQNHIVSIETSIGGPPLVIGPEVDMLVWTPSAFDKFVAPYYYRQRGAKYVEDLYNRLNKSAYGIFEHWWPTFDMITAEERQERLPKGPKQ